MASTPVKFRFWGVRGSLPSPGPETNIFGGDTACAEVVTANTRVILDAGSGIRRLGLEMMREPDDRETFILITHPHFDHICGLPFFTPIFVPGNAFRIISGPPHDFSDLMPRLFCRPFFPVEVDMLGSDVSFQLAPERGRIRLNDEISVVTAPMNHPGGCTGYRIEVDDFAFAWVTDTEHTEGQTDRNAIALMEGADLAVYDAAYTVDEYPNHVGWGHSTPEEGMRLARLAGAKKLALFHHNPTRTDDQMRRIEKEAQRNFAGAFAARDGLSLHFAPQKAVA